MPPFLYCLLLLSFFLSFFQGALQVSDEELLAGLSRCAELQALPMASGRVLF